MTERQSLTKPEEALALEHNRRFTLDARTVIKSTAEATFRFNSTQIRTEHLLLGIIADPENHASKFIQGKGVDPKKIKDQTEFLSETGKKPASAKELEMSPRFKKIMMLASEEAQGGKINHVHMLIGIIREGEGIAAGVLESFNIGIKDLDALRTHAKTLRELLLLEQATLGEV